METKEPIISLRDFNLNEYNVMNNILVHKEMNVNDKIYKYIDINYLIDMLKSQALYVANRKSFSDRRNMIWAKSMEL